MAQQLDLTLALACSCSASGLEGSRGLFAPIFFLLLTERQRLIPTELSCEPEPSRLRDLCGWKRVLSPEGGSWVRKAFWNLKVHPAGGSERALACHS